MADAVKPPLVTELRQWPLCEICDRLGLTVESFVIPRDVSTLSGHAPRSFPNSSTIDSSSVSSLRSGGRPVQLGSFNEIRARQHQCALCRLVAQSISSYDLDRALAEHGSSILDLARCELSCEIDGRDLLNTKGAMAKNRTRRLRVQWNHRALQEYGSYLVFMAPEQPWRPDSETQAASRREVHFLGRGITSRKERTVLIKSWVDLCRTHHKSHCEDRHGNDEEFKKMLEGSYFGVLDVVNMQLCVLPHQSKENRFTHEPYVALSYVWGQRKQGEPQPYTTVRENILLHQNHGGLEGAYPQLPRAVRDAIKLVRQLGMRYMWIDSICIVQDSFRSWKSNTQRMHMIYSFASLTICAADGEDSRTGLEAIYTESPNQVQATCAPGVTLMVSKPPETAIRASRWNQRAWTFQERLTSRRCLIFANNRVYFQCRSTSMSEDIYAQGHGTAWSLDSIHAPLQMLKELKTRAIWFYMNCVSLYTSRELTMSRDILAAFSGVISLMQKVIRAPFVFGLPTSHLDLALLWQPANSVRPRIAEDQNDKSFDVEFPSWAWCGWVGSKVEYGAGVQDCLTNVHEWLVNHTWICWYIRDGHGNLRPLWDKLAASEDDSLETRWRGYRGRRVNNIEYDAEKVRGPPMMKENGRLPLDTEMPRGPDVQYEVAQVTSQSRVAYGEDSRRLRENERLAGLLAQHQFALGMYGEFTQIDPRDPRLDPLLDPRMGGRVLDGEQSYATAVIRRNRDCPASRSPPQYHHRRGRDSVSPSFPPREHKRARIDSDVNKPQNRHQPNRPEVGNKEASTLPEPVEGPDSGPQEQRRRRYTVNRDYDEGSSKHYDIFGRALWDETRHRPQNEFFRTVPDHPFRVLKTPGGYSDELDKDEPCQPRLQFWTWKRSFHLRRLETQDGLVDTGLHRCDITDYLGDWCGSIVVNESWIKDESATQQAAPLICDFIALSEAKSFSTVECPVWTYYIPKERHESEWDVFYVLLVKYHPKSSDWHRVALGKIFRAGFSLNDDEWMEIVLG